MGLVIVVRCGMLVESSGKSIYILSVVEKGEEDIVDVEEEFLGEP